MDLVHMTIAVSGRFTLARDERERRAVVRRLVRVAGPWLVVFCLVDEHLHALLRANHARTIARNIRATLLAARPGIGLDPPHLKPIANLDHLKSVVGYVLRQPLHHELPGHPALWSGSCFADLIGARLLPGGFSRRILVEELPRFRGRDLLAMVGLEPEPFVPVDDATLRGLGPTGLIDLAAGVLGFGPELDLRARSTTRVRALAVGLARRVGQPMVEMARTLAITRQSTHELSRRPLDQVLELALRTRASFVARCRAAAYPTWLLPKKHGRA